MEGSNALKLNYQKNVKTFENVKKMFIYFILSFFICHNEFVTPDWKKFGFDRFPNLYHL